MAALVLVLVGLLISCAGAASEPAAAAPEPAAAAAVADRAMDRFVAAWRTGDWQPFLDTTTPEFSFWFPIGPHVGRHEGAAGQQKLSEWARQNGTSGARLESVVRSREVTEAGVIYQTEAQGTAGPAVGYNNWEVIVLTVSGDRISGLHEYWGSFPAPSQ